MPSANSTNKHPFDTSDSENTKKTISKMISRLPKLQPVLQFDSKEQDNLIPTTNSTVTTACMSENGLSNAELNFKKDSGDITNGEASCDNCIQELNGTNGTTKCFTKTDFPTMRFINGAKTPVNDQLTNASIPSLDNKKSNTTIPWNKHKIQQLLIKAPSFLMIESLVWNLCCVYEEDIIKRQAMFLALCKSLQNLNVLGSTYLEESLQPMRNLISTKFNKEILRLKNDISQEHINHFSPILDLKYLSQSNLKKCFFEFNRYGNEFEEIEEIAKGGFGIVKKARHRFDNCIYAVKEIVFPFKSLKSFEQIIREVKLYANLKPHPNIVAYKTAWIQNLILPEKNYRQRTYTKKSRTFTKTNHIDKEITNITTTSIDDDVKLHQNGLNKNDNSSNCTSSSSSTSSSSTSLSSFSSSIHFLSDSMKGSPVEMVRRDAAQILEYSNKFDDIFQSSPLNQDITDIDNSRSHSRQKDFSNEKDDNNDSFSDDVSDSEDSILPKCDYSGNCKELATNSQYTIESFVSSTQSFSAMLYIQMELCGMNLRQYLDRRNQCYFEKFKTLKDTSGVDISILSFIDEQLEFDHFNQILEGIQYIHSQDMIHRDLKPQNILFSLDGKTLKIGDFGLATLHHQHQQCTPSNLTVESFAIQSPNLSTKSKTKHAKVLGTFVYAAPEQRTQRDYDHKVDMYSLGMILFELFYPIQTEMERAELIRTLKEVRQLPDDFLRRWPQLTTIILQFTSNSPHERPKSIEEMANLYGKSVKKLCSPSSHQPLISLDGELLSTSALIEQLQSENASLKKQIKNKDNRICELEQMVFELQQKQSSNFVSSFSWWSFIRSPFG